MFGITVLCFLLLGHVCVNGDQICYHPLGCFSNEPPFNNTEGTLPLDPGFIRTTFRVFTQQNDQPWVIDNNNLDGIRITAFDPVLPTKFIIHGFLQHAEVSWVLDMAHELLLKEPMNVITVDWGHGSGFPYTQAAANTRVAGAETARLIHFLMDHMGMSSSQFHLIGHSLGAHVAGYVGWRINDIQRITGLDPAQPAFQGAGLAARLDKTDAVFVDVIHTDGSTFEAVSGYGMLDPVGDIDFYPNGGENQPGCPASPVMGFLSAYYNTGMESAETALSCSHSRSIYLFTESINSACPFVAYPCSSFQKFKKGLCLDCGNMHCPVMGYEADHYKISTGSFYLQTSNVSPFCGHHYHVTLNTSPSMPETEGRINVKLFGVHGTTQPFDINASDLNIMGGEHKDMMYIAREDLGEIHKVQVKYGESRHVLQWLFGHSYLQLSTIKVEMGSFGHTLYFCARNRTIPNGGRFLFQNPTHNVTLC